MIGFFKLLRMARLMAAQNSLLPSDFAHAPLSIRVLRRIFVLGVPRFDTQNHESGGDGDGFSKRIQKLGPGYIKLGQFLATRPDIIGASGAADLRHLQDRLPPFSEKHARAILQRELGDAADIIGDLGAPIAAASIAQVHKTHFVDTPQQKIAIKVLRPNIETIFARELSVMARAAGFSERLLKSARRLRPVAAIETLRRTVELELDLRLEAAALSEMAENAANDEGFHVPRPLWNAVSRRVLALEWVDGTPISDIDTLRAKQIDLSALATRLMRIFLTHALRDGFFHADMHQGNLLVKDDGAIIAIDFGITGRLDKASRRFLAEILHGFITRDYHKVAKVHFEAGYVPPRQSIEAFSQALRAIGEPIRGQNADQISMARLLTQLFEVTAQFDMETQPQLLLLQKTMVSVEGVARSLNPQLNIWDASEPIVREWLAASGRPEAILNDTIETIQAAVGALKSLPKRFDEMTAPPPQPPMRDRFSRALAWAALLIAGGVAIIFIIHHAPI